MPPEERRGLTRCQSCTIDSEAKAEHFEAKKKKNCEGTRLGIPDSKPPRARKNLKHALATAKSQIAWARRDTELLSPSQQFEGHWSPHQKSNCDPPPTWSAKNPLLLLCPVASRGFSSYHHHPRGPPKSPPPLLLCPVRILRPLRSHIFGKHTRRLRPDTLVFERYTLRASSASC